MKKHQFSLTVLSLCLLLAACGSSDSKKPEKKKNHGNIQSLAQASVKSLGCEDLRDLLFEYVQRALLIPGANLSSEDLSEIWLLSFQSEKQIVLPESSQALKSLEIFFQHLISDIPEKFKVGSAMELKRLLGALKIGDRSTKLAREAQAELDILLQELSHQLPIGEVTCAEDQEWQQSVSSLASPVWGVRKALATAYQSCQALKLPPLTQKVPSVEGIEDLGAYPGSWTGRILKISDPVAVARTHYYIKDQVPTSQCLSVKKNLMIYDFGGKPFTTSDPDGNLNYWKGNNDGSPGLGVDCSGFVFSSIAAGGLRLQTGKKLKAFEVEDYPARMYMNPEDNGFTCLAKVKMGKKAGWLQPGDVMASKYHVVMVERVGADPFGILKHKDCNISYRDFDFVIAQSSPDQGNIGINRYEAKEYLAPFSHFIFKNGLETYAREACMAYYNGKEVVTSSSEFSIIRHKMTPECLQPEIKLESQACIEQCSELFE